MASAHPNLLKVHFDLCTLDLSGWVCLMPPVPEKFLTSPAPNQILAAAKEVGLATWENEALVIKNRSATSSYLMLKSLLASYP